MTQWYYTQGSPRLNQQQHGPLPAENLTELFRSGRIGLDTLVWCEGQPKWAPLGNFAAELGLTSHPGAPVPPPLPQMPAPLASAQQSRPASGLSGCMIAVIVVAVLAIPLVAILAAIALPAYQDYTLRAKVVGVLPAAASLKIDVSAYLAQHQSCPGNDDAGFGAPDSYASDNVATATVGKFENERCGIELILRGTGSEGLDGKALWLEYEASEDSWKCSSEIDDRYLPIQCRG